MEELKTIWDKVTINKCKYVNMEDRIAIHLNRTLNECFIIEGIGVEIFQSLRSKECLDTFLTTMIKKYDVQLSELIEDTKKFINLLIEENIVSINNTYYYNKYYDIMNYYDNDLSNKNSLEVQKFYFQNRKPYKVFYETTYKCNLKCPHCYLGDEKYIEKNSIPFNRVKVILDELDSLGLFELVITGGEIALYDDLIPLLNHLSNKNILVTLLTNGTCFNENIIDKIISTGIHDIRISIYGDESFHDNFVNMKGSFKKSINTLETFRKKANIGTAVCILTKDNVTTVNDLKMYLKGKGIPLSVTPLVFPTIYGDKKPIKLRLDRSQLYKYIQELDINVGGNLCTAGISRFRITPDGQVNPCEMLRHINLGNINERSFKSILQGEEMNKWIETYNSMQNQECKSCTKKSHCVNCMGLSYLETGELNNKTKFACNLANIQSDIYDK